MFCSLVVGKTSIFSPYRSDVLLEVRTESKNGAMMTTIIFAANNDKLLFLFLISLGSCFLSLAYGTLSLSFAKKERGRERISFKIIDIEFMRDRLSLYIFI